MPVVIKPKPKPKSRRTVSPPKPKPKSRRTVSPPRPNPRRSPDYDPMYSDKAVNKYREKHGLNTEPRQEVEILMSMSRETNEPDFYDDFERKDPDWPKGTIIKENPYMFTKGGMYKKPQMKHGGMHKGKQHSYAAGGKVKEI